MKFPVAPLQRAALGVAACAIVAASVSAAAIVTRPASSSSDQPTVTLAEPASDEVTTTTTEPVTLATMAEETLAPQRAEKAADRAESAAGRAEVAAAHVDQVAATTTTVPTTTSSTIITRPAPVETADPVVTTTTTAPKQWVEIARFPVAAGGASSGPALAGTIDVTTGLLRVRRLGECCEDGLPVVWLTDTGATSAMFNDNQPDVESGNVLLEDYASGKKWVGWRGPWSAGTRAVNVGMIQGGGSPYTGSGAAGELVIEEYR